MPDIDLFDDPVTPADVIEIFNATPEPDTQAAQPLPLQFELPKLRPNDPDEASIVVDLGLSLEYVLKAYHEATVGRDEAAARVKAAQAVLAAYDARAAAIEEDERVHKMIHVWVEQNAKRGSKSCNISLAGAGLPDVSYKLGERAQQPSVEVYDETALLSAATKMYNPDPNAEQIGPMFKRVPAYYKLDKTALNDLTTKKGVVLEGVRVIERGDKQYMKEA